MSAAPVTRTTIAAPLRAAAGTSLLVDCAGGRVGGAKRLLNEFDLYLRDREPPGLQVIGRDRTLDPAWLLRREREQTRTRRFELSLALNNVSFVAAGRQRHVLVHGAQHFLRRDEIRQLGRRISPVVHAQAPVVWAALLRADRIFVPSTSMAERVATYVPAVRNRLTVAFNPVTPPDAIHQVDAMHHVDTARSRDRDSAAVDFLCPVVILPQKLLTGRLRAGLAALDILAGPPHRIDATLSVTGRAEQLEDPAVACHPRLRLVGEHSAEVVIAMMARCDGIFFPLELESFGYPMAEGRRMGVPVIARDSAHNREIAGPALVGYQRESGEDIAAAMHAAQAASRSRALKPDEAGHFDRGPYFDQLLGLSPAG
ncbi:glycosyltransferase [Frankia sp. R82]|uniref:glycosyltransferase n=1 Tax=Frankia sp. R82 TaxID=2950553 RepID=UPI002043CA26|nr:glycosyltransferase [Frankia sp. R82]MCM3884720.1 glycosyltransferase family 1 protein [Frankia sp. R82]